MTTLNTLNTDMGDILLTHLNTPAQDCSITMPVVSGKSAYDLAVENGYVGDLDAWLASIKGWQPVTSEEFLNLLNGELEKSPLLAELRTGINTSNDSIKAEIQARIAAINAMNNELIAETQQRISDMQLYSAQLLSETQNRIADIENVRNQLLAEVDARLLETQQLADDILAEQVKRVSELTELGNFIDSLDSKVDTNHTFLLEHYSTSSSTTSEIADKISALRTTYIDPALNTKATVTSVEQVKTSITNINGELVTVGSKLDGVIAESGKNKQDIAAVWTDMQVRVEAESALSTRIDNVVATTYDHDARIANEVKARTDADSAMASDISTMSTRVGTTEGKITNLEKVTTDTNSSLSTVTSKLDNLITVVDTKASSQAVTDLASKVTTAEGKITSQGTSITNLNNSVSTAQSTADSKGKIIYSTTAPAVADRLSQNLWIDTTSNYNTPKRWNGSAWLAVTDKVALDALTQANTNKDAITTKADASAVSTLANRVTSAEGNITSNSNSITTLNNNLSTLTNTVNTKADSSALSSLDSKVTSLEGNVTSQGSSITTLNNSLTTTNNNVSAKGKIIYSTTAPVAADQLTQNLWIDTTNNANTPKRWNGTAWVVVTDKVATDALAAANAATTLANTKADSSALTALDSKVTNVDGKVTTNSNSITSLNSRMSAAEGNISTKADATALNVYYTKTEADTNSTAIAAGEVSKFSASLGGSLQDNLVIGGNTSKTKTGGYLMVSYNLSKNLQSTGKKITIRAKVTFDNGGATVAHIRTYIGGGTLVAEKDYIYPCVETVYEMTMTTINRADADKINFYCFPATQTLPTLTVHWVEVYEGESKLLSAVDANANAIQTTNSEVTRVDGKTTANADAITGLTSRMDTVEGQVSTKADSSAVTGLESRVNTAENNINSQSSSLTSLSNKYESSKGKASLIPDYFMTSAEQWRSHYGYNLVPYLITVTDGKIGNTVFRKPKEVSSCWNYSRTALPNDRAYKLSMWVRREVGSTGSIYFTCNLIGIDGIHDTNYTSVGKSVPADGNWYLVEHVWDLRSSKDTSPQLAFGFALNHSSSGYYCDMQGYKVESVIGLSDTDNTVASSSALSSLTSRVTAAEGTITSQGSSITDLQNSVSSINGTLSNKADASALNALTNRVTNTEGSISTQSSKVTTLENSLTTTTDTANKALSAVTVTDTRSTNELPSWYWSNYPKRIVNEFKTASAIGVTGLGTYVNLETRVYYGDSSGGAIIQTAYAADNMLLQMTRKSASTTAWTAWSQPLKTLSDTVNTKADATAVSDLTSRVTAAEGNITSQSNKTTLLENNLSSTDALAKAAVPSVKTFTKSKSFSYVYTHDDDRAGIVGNIVISTPITFTSKMFSITGIGYNYLLNQSSIDFNVSGYANSGTSIVNHSANNYGRLPIRIRLGVKNGTLCIILTSMSSGNKWEYPKFSLSAVIGYTVAPDTWKDGWTSSMVLEADLATAGITAIVEPTMVDVSKELNANASALSTLSSDVSVIDGKVTATSSDVTTLTTTVNGHTSTLQTNATTLNGLSAQYTVKVDVNGRVAGFGLASTAINGTPTSEFVVVVDKFYIAPPGTTGKGTSPFIVTTATTTINGVSVPAGTYIKDAFIYNGSIDSARIRDGAIISAKIFDAAIVSAKIADGNITTAKIGDLQVSNAKIANLAVDSIKLADLAVTNAKIANATITDAKIANLDAAKITTGYLSADRINANTITGDKIKANTSITAPTINGGLISGSEININNMFKVSPTGDLLAKSGTFEGTVLADRISGTIDIESLKSSAWMGGYYCIFYRTVNSVLARTNQPCLVPSRGSIIANFSDFMNAAKIVYAIDLKIKNAVTITQSLVRVDDDLDIVVFKDGVQQAANHYTSGSNMQDISTYLPSGNVTIEYRVNNSKGGECGITLFGDFVDNNNIKFA